MYIAKLFPNESCSWPKSKVLREGKKSIFSIVFMFLYKILCGKKQLR